MTAYREMPKYQCHKQVWALKIKTVAVHASGDTAVSDAEFQASDAFQGAHLITVEDGYAPFHVSADWFRKHKPEAGGYYVVYEDGYKSYSPAAAFESGYSPLADAHVALTVVDPGPDSHASAVLYPAIERAMSELGALHPAFNFAVNRAFNILHDAFWSECPAPASAVPKRRETADAEHHSV